MHQLTCHNCLYSCPQESIRPGSSARCFGRHPPLSFSESGWGLQWLVIGCPHSNAKVFHWRSRRTGKRTWAFLNHYVIPLALQAFFLRRWEEGGILLGSSSCTSHFGFGSVPRGKPFLGWHSPPLLNISNVRKCQGLWYKKYSKTYTSP